MKKLLATLLAVTMTMGLMACGAKESAPGAEAEKPAVEAEKPAAGSNPEVSLIVAHQSTEGESRYAGFETFKEVIEGEDVGISVKLYPAGQMVSTDRDSVEALSMDEIDMTCVADVQFGPHVEEFYVFNADYLFDSFEQSKEVLEGEAGQGLIDACAAKDNNIMVSGFMGGAPRIFWNNIRPVATLEDFKNIKSRTAENPINVKELESLGCIPTPMNWSEMYTGLQQGTIEGLISSPPPIIQQGIVEVLDHATTTNHSYNINIMLFNQTTYDSFTDEQKAAYEKAVKAALEVQWEMEGNIMDDSLQALKDREGFTLTEMTEEDRAALAETMIAATEPLVIESCGQEILDMFRK